MQRDVYRASPKTAGFYVVNETLKTIVEEYA